MGRCLVLLVGQEEAWELGELTSQRQSSPLKPQDNCLQNRCRWVSLTDI